MEMASLSTLAIVAISPFDISAEITGVKGPKDPLDQASAGSISSRRAPQKRMAGYAVADATSVEGSRPATVSPRLTSFTVLRS